MFVNSCRIAVYKLRETIMNSAINTPSYGADTLNVKHGVGTKFIEDFSGRFEEIPALKAKLEKAVALSKEKNNRPVIVSYCSEKGGVGKSTIAVASAQLLANLGFKVFVVDIDNNESSHDLLTSRRKNIQEVLTKAANNKVDEKEIIDYKESLDPIVDSALVDKDLFDVNFAKQITDGSEYDFIIFDTAGHKDKRQENFNLDKLNQPGEVHMILAYLSNCVVVPMRITPLDITRGTRFFYPLSQFIYHLEKMNINIVNTQARILVNASERTGAGVKNLDQFMESSYNKFKTIIRRSDKIAFAQYFEGVQTAFTTKVAPQVQQSFLEVLDQIADDAATSLGE